MRIVDPGTGKSYIQKSCVRYDEPGQPRELTFFCYRYYAVGSARPSEYLQGVPPAAKEATAW